MCLYFLPTNNIISNEGFLALRGEYFFEVVVLRNKYIIFVAAALVLLVLGGGVYMYLQGGEDMEAMEPLDSKDIPKEVLIWLDLDKTNSGYAAFYGQGSLFLAVKLGQRPTGGYSVTIGDCKQEDCRVTVCVQENKPSPWDMVTQVLTYPSGVASFECHEPPEIVCFTTKSGSVLAQVPVEKLGTE